MKILIISYSLQECCSRCSPFNPGWHYCRPKNWPRSSVDQLFSADLLNDWHMLKTFEKLVIHILDKYFLAFLHSFVAHQAISKHLRLHKYMHGYSDKHDNSFYVTVISRLWEIDFCLLLFSVKCVENFQNLRLSRIEKQVYWISLWLGRRFLRKTIFKIMYYNQQITQCCPEYLRKKIQILLKPPHLFVKVAHQQQHPSNQP